MTKNEMKKTETAVVREQRAAIVEAARRMTPEQRKMLIALLGAIVDKPITKKYLT